MITVRILQAMKSHVCITGGRKKDTNNSLNIQGMVCME